MKKKTIQWNKAVDISAINDQNKKIEYDRLLDEIKTTDASMLDSADIHFYCNSLNEAQQRKEEFTPNEIRRLMLLNSKNSSFGMLNTFGYEDDDIFDFF